MGVTLAISSITSEGDAKSKPEAPIRCARSQMISQSALEDPTGSIALRTRCTRRSVPVKVPSFSA